MKTLWVVLALGASLCNALDSDNCDNFLSCLNAELYDNLTRIGQQDVYRISDNLLLERFERVDGDELEAKRLLAKKNAISTFVLMKKIAGLFETHALRYKLTRGLDVAVFRDRVDGEDKISVGLLADPPQRGARTFGVAIFRKRMMYILLAMTFKLGVMTSLLATILVLVLKGLKIGVLLLMLTFGSVFAKWKGHDAHHHEDHKGIHVHVHSDPHQQAYSAWAPEDPYHHVHPQHVHPQHVHPQHVYQRRNNGQLYSVRDDASAGFPAVFRPPVQSYQAKGGQGYIPTRGQALYGQSAGVGQYLAAAGLGYQGAGYRSQEGGYPVTDVDRRGGVPVARQGYEVERQPEFAQVYRRKSGYEDAEEDDEEAGSYAA